ncbi:hypothetical protein [Candidatus Cyanaurora vandensis]|uniref:hypothetical protein n=1 Tax=Candidatus Cyanaurora vandensis TaxID=2714958 RepID=UPI00257C6B3E|nr:hypothetical protein [Candidatus Cyanaurora vandensis]
MTNTQRWVGFLAGVAVLGAGGTYLQVSAAEPQPRMQAALNALQTARRELTQATTDKGGYRDKALQSVDQAIVQVRRGIAYDNRNPKN